MYKLLWSINFYKKEAAAKILRPRCSTLLNEKEWKRAHLFLIKNLDLSRNIEDSQGVTASFMKTEIKLCAC